ncbi:DMT family transporter [Zhihengliuella sp.]|uniref:DMT family transporter n=1 Tax=Zhihengliuella sp. TaxID=1954483 RepID=UPI0028116528|nr:DMT family transporter [Zhihengliuella sp.]
MLMIILGCLSMGVANAVVGAVIGTETVFLFMGVAFLCASLAGQASHCARAGRLLPQLDWSHVAALNLATLMTFGAFYLALAWIPASLAAGVEAAFAPLATLLLALWRKKRAPWSVWLLALSVFACSIAFGATQAQSSPAGNQYVVGVLLALVAGAGMAILAILSRSLGERGVDASSILAVRYHLAYIVAFGLAARDYGFEGDIAVLLHDLSWIVPLGLAAVALPLFLIQSGMMRTDPTLTAILMASVPAISFLTETTWFGWSHGIASWTLLALLVLLVCVYGVVDQRRSRLSVASAAVSRDHSERSGLPEGLTAHELISGDT